MIFALFSILVVIAIVSSCIEFFMRIRLTQKESGGEKLAWWRRGGDEVVSAYSQLFPDTWLPLFRQAAFWLLIAAAGFVLILVLLKSH
jgi:hypothetical protein